MRVARSAQEVAARAQLSVVQVNARLDSARAKIFAARERKVRPGRDDKILASWNALAIIGMTRAARRLGRAEWLASARRAFAFIRASMWRDGRLVATWNEGQARLNAYLDDYAFLLAATLDILQADFRSEDVRKLGSRGAFL